MNPKVVEVMASPTSNREKSADKLDFLLTRPEAFHIVRNKLKAKKSLEGIEERKGMNEQERRRLCDAIKKLDPENEIVEVDFDARWGCCFPP